MAAPLAALAVIRAALQDAPTAELLTRPGWTTQRLAVALELAGWTITPAPPVHGPQKPAQSI
jgi:hypothetical protein